MFFIDIIYFKSYLHSIKSIKFCFENELKVIMTIVWKLKSHSLVQWPDVGGQLKWFKTVEGFAARVPHPFRVLWTDT